MWGEHTCLWVVYTEFNSPLQTATLVLHRQGVASPSAPSLGWRWTRASLLPTWVGGHYGSHMHMFHKESVSYLRHPEEITNYSFRFISLPRSFPRSGLLGTNGATRWGESKASISLIVISGRSACSISCKTSGAWSDGYTVYARTGSFKQIYGFNNDPSHFSGCRHERRTTCLL